MTITAYGYGALQAQRADQNFRSLKATMSELQLQLTTGKRATSYAALGADAIKSLSGRANLSGIEATRDNVSDAQLRVKIMSAGITQVQKISSSLRTSLAGTFNQTNIGQTSAIISAEDGLRQVVDIMNSQVNGRALFGGRDQDGDPVVPFDTLMNGDATHAGLKQMISERKSADLGANGLGRLTATTTATGITVGEEAAGLPYGMKLGTASATGTAIVATNMAGPPKSVNFDVPTQPADGDTLSLTLTLPDGATTTISLTARAAGSTAIGTNFTIGATPAETAANLQAAVTSAVQDTAQTKLASSSSMTASAAFFAGTPSNPPQRVAGPPYDTATASVAGTASNTVIWYQGDDGTGSPRETAPVRTGDGTSVAIGARATEPGFRDTLVVLGALAADSFPATDTTAQKRYAAMADRVSEALADDTDIKDMASSFATANAGLTDSMKRLDLAKVQVTDMLSDVEDAEPNEAAMKLMATQTRLQAAYQVTTTIAKMSIVDFL